MSVVRLLLYIPNQLKLLASRILLGLKMVFSKKSYLVKTGFVHSRIQDSLRYKDGNYLPWMNYSMIHLFNERLHSDLTVFEYGSGSSTMYFAERVKEITSIEYDHDWYDKVLEYTSEMQNASVNFIPLSDDYHRSIAQLGKGKKFDLVIVDGRHRVESAIFSFDHISENGVIILDDTHRQHYQGAFEFFESKGIQHLTLTGLKPTGFGDDQTTIFYRSGKNCLGI